MSMMRALKSSRAAILTGVFSPYTTHEDSSIIRFKVLVRFDNASLSDLFDQILQGPYVFLPTVLPATVARRIKYTVGAQWRLHVCVA